MRLRFRALVFTIGALFLVGNAAAQVPEGYPATYQSLIDQAKKEGRLTIVGTNGIAQVNPLLTEFNKLYPFVKVEYSELNSITLFNRLSSEIAAGGTTADVAISGASDLHLKMGQQGLAMTYPSPEKPFIGATNAWNDQVYNVDLEPVCNLYNKNLVKEAELPKTHADLRNLMVSDAARFRGKINMYDIERSAVGFGILYRDSKQDKDFWQLPAALAKADAKFHPGGFVMSEKVGSGETAIAFNIPCQILAALSNNPSIGFFLFEDYTIMTSQSALIAKSATNTAAAKLFVDFLLSKRGQQLFADMPGIYPVRSDIKGSDTTGLQRKGIDVSAPALNDALLEPLDPTKRTEFLNRWKTALRDGVGK